MWIFDQDKREDRRDVADLKELLKTQLAALGEGRYELTLRTRDDQVSYAHVSAADILDRVRDLRAVNLAGTDVAIRPAERSGLVLLRDVPAAQVADLTQDGFPPVLLTEPAPARFDAWVRVDSVGIQRGLHDSMAQLLAARYDLDTRTAGAEQAAALAGFTTRDDPDRRIPLVSADRESRVAPAALDLADWVLEHAQLDPALVDDQRGRWVPPDHRNEAARAAAARLDQVLGDRDPAARGGASPAAAPDRFTHPTPEHYMVAVYADLHAEQRVAHEVAGRQDAATRDQAASEAARAAAQEFHARFPYQQPDTFAAVLRANGVEDATIAAAVRAGFGDPPRGPDQAALRAELGGALRAAGLPVETGLALPVHPHPPAPPAPPAEPPYAAQFGTLRQALLEGGQGRLDERQAEWGVAHQLVDTYPQLTRDEIAEALDKGGASGQGQGRTPPERDAYIAWTADKVVAAAQSPQGQEPARGQERHQKTSDGDHGR
jgi:hypothetical protein